MNALAKSSMLLLPATAIAVFVYIWVGDEGFDPVRSRSQPQEEICKRDGVRLAQLQARPSLDEAVRFGGELQCLQLLPQVETILDSLSHTARSSTVSSPNGPASDTIPASEAAPTTASPVMAAKSAALDDACKHDETRLANLQANPTADEAIRLERELTCTKLAPQLLAILDRLSRAIATEAAPTSAATGAIDTNSAREATPPPSATPAREATSTAATDACKQDEERLARVRTNPSSEEATRFAQELRCETLRPELLALTGELPNPPPTQIDGISNEARGARNAVNDAQPPSQAIADAERRIAALESDKEALAAEVSRLQHDREATSAEQAATPSPQPASPAERSEAEAASQAAAGAERRIAELESEKAALTGEVSRLQRDREASSAEQTKPIAPPPPAVPAERSDAEPVAALASLPEGMPARVLIRYLKNNADARAQAEKLASALAAQDVEVTDVRESRTAIRTELSFSYAPDETIARRVGRIVGVSAVRRLQPKDGLMVRPGTVELTLSGDSHLAVIKTTSTRESNHE
jgi:hypothetical protein